MDKITITEALAEIKTIEKRLEKKRAAVLTNLGRDSQLRDPFEKDGGSVDFVARERQGIDDLERRVVAIRAAIAKSNLETKTTIGEVEKTVFEWLAWRREVSGNRSNFLASINATIKNAREKIQQRGGRVSGVGITAAAIVSGEEKKVPELLLHIDEKLLLEEQEKLEKTLGELDGRLSLLNATTPIQISA